MPVFVVSRRWGLPRTRETARRMRARLAPYGRKAWSKRNALYRTARRRIGVMEDRRASPLGASLERR